MRMAGRAYSLRAGYPGGRSRWGPIFRKQPRVSPNLHYTMGIGSIQDRGVDPSSAKFANDLEPVLRLPSVPAQACGGVTFIFYIPYRSPANPFACLWVF